MEKLIRFLKDEEGVTAIEYGLIAALIAVFIIGGEVSGRWPRQHVLDVATELGAAAQ